MLLRWEQREPYRISERRLKVNFERTVMFARLNVDSLWQSEHKRSQTRPSTSWFLH